MISKCYHHISLKTYYQGAKMVSATFLKLLGFFLSVILYTSSLSSQSFNADFIRYLDKDGLTYKDYTRVQSYGMNSWHYIKKGKMPEDEYVFISPNEYKIIPLIDEGYNQIVFNQGSFSLIKEDTLREEVIIKNGQYIFQNDVDPDTEGNYGCFAKPDGFRTLNYVWVFPDNMEVISYESNRDGDWRLENQTLSYIGFEQNNVLFKIVYKIAETAPLILIDRNVVLKDTVEVNNKAITISIWDDSQIDNDVISIKINDEWIVKYLEAKNERIKFKYFLTQPENYIVLRADNIGLIPPNTTAINIDDGTNSRTIVLNSDLGMSEAIRINLNTDN
jgi:hypothetical protein